MPDTAAADLRRIVLEQTRAEVGVPVLLFTTATLTEPSTAEVTHPVDEVTETAKRLGLDLDDLPLFSLDAYLLQTALGESAARSRR